MIVSLSWEKYHGNIIANKTIANRDLKTETHQDKNYVIDQNFTEQNIHNT